MSVDPAGRPKVLVIAGPTASGKSQLAVTLARALDGEVLNFDSRQVYRGLDVGSAKPTVAEREGIPHHLFDLVEPEETFSAARFRAEALQRATEVSGRGRLPILVGGTGLYLRVLERGLFEGPARDERIHQRLDRIADGGGLPRLRRWLERVDPERAACIGKGDRQRLLRALDVYLQSGRPMSAHLREAPPVVLPFDLLKLAPEWPRELLYQRIHERAQVMMANGLLGEVESLGSRPGFGPAGRSSLRTRPAAAVANAGTRGRGATAVEFAARFRAHDGASLAASSAPVRRAIVFAATRTGGTARRNRARV